MKTKEQGAFEAPIKSSHKTIGEMYTNF
jgi:hypothetical protein